MNPNRLSRSTASAASARALLAVLVLATGACGGREDDGSAAAPTSGADADRATALTAQPLFDERGRPAAAASAAQPADPTLRTRAGLYASPDQYQWEALMSSPVTILVDLDAAGSAQAAIDGTLAARDPTFPAPATLAWFVKSADPRAGALLADALTGLGLNQVFLIVRTPDGAR